MAQDLQRARELFLHAVGQLPPEQWDAYLVQACGPDEELRRQAARLLQAHREAGSFLDQPAAGLAATGAFARGPEGGAAAVPPEIAGTVIGPYKLLEQIGEGGMGAVWMAQQTEPVKRLVALKLIKAGMDSKQVLARFEAERQALALMDHPNIARVLDAGTTAAGRPFFVMELVKGILITRYCDEHRLTPKERLELFVPVCQAVQHAHQKGIIHRDLKPSNVLIALYDGRPVPKVIDFGVAKATGQQLTERTLVTGFGAVVGTLEYMSPEQAELNQLDIDTRSDIYTLGVLLYELLTGTTPLDKKRLKEAAMLEALRLIREEEPPRPSTRLSTTASWPSIAVNRGLEPKRLRGLVRGELDWIVMKALEKDRNRRYETANGFALDIRRYLAGEPVRAAPASQWYRLRKLVRRHRGPVLAAGLVLLTLVGGIVATTWQALRATDAEAAAVADKTAAVEAKGVALTEADRNRRLLYSADVHMASQAWQSEEGTVAQCKDLLLAHVPGPGQPDLREFCWRYQWRLLHRGSVVRLPAVPRAAGVSADDRVVTLDESGKVNAWLISNRTAREQSTLGGAGVQDGTLSRNGEVAAVIDRDGSPKVFDVRSGRQKGRIRAPSALVNVKLSADGRFLVGVGRDKHARVWDAASGSELYDYLMIDPTAKEMDLSLDGKQLLASSTAEGTRVVLYRAGEEKPLVLNWEEGLGFNRLHGALSPDGKLAAVAVAGNYIEFYDTTTGKRPQSVLPTRSVATRVTFSPDGNQLAVGERTGLVTLWRLPRPTPVPAPLPPRGSGAGEGGGQPRPRNLKGHEAAIAALAFTADGRKLISIGQDNTARCWDLDDQEESRVVRKGGGDGLSYSPDGRYVAVADVDGIRVRDLASTDPPRSLTTRRSKRTVFSPDGRTIAGGPDHRVTLWDAKTGELLATLSEADPAERDPENGFSNLNALVFSPDGRWLAAGFGALFNWPRDAPQKVMVFDVAQRKVHRTFATPTQVSAVAFSAAGTLLAAAGHNGTVWLWDTSTWDEIGRWQGPAGTGYASILFLSVGQMGEAGRPGGILATGSRSGRIDLWDVRTRALAGQLQGHITLVSFMALSPDGRTLATASCDRSIKLWDTGTGRELRTLGREEGWVFCVAFSPDGNTLASTGLNGGVLRLWQASTKPTVAAELAELELQAKTSGRGTATQRQ
jgi:WD40 repeat protein/serine/threonine protein kinase